MSNLLSDNLTPEVLANTYLDTANIVAEVPELLSDGYSGMNLKLVIDILSRIAE